MSKKFFLILVLTVTANSHYIRAAEICDITDEMNRSGNSSMLSGIIDSVSNLTRLGRKQNANRIIEIGTQETPVVETTETQIVFHEEHHTKEMSNQAKTLFGISFDKKQLLPFGIGAIAIIIICDVAYVLYKNNKNKYGWTLEKVNQDVKQFVIQHKTVLTSAVIATIVAAIAASYAKKHGINSVTIYNSVTKLFTKQSTKMSHVTK